MNKVVVISQSFFFSFPKKKVRKNHRPFTHNIPHTHTRAITHIYISLMAFLLLPFACLLKIGTLVEELAALEQKLLDLGLLALCEGLRAGKRLEDEGQRFSHVLNFAL